MNTSFVEPEQATSAREVSLHPLNEAYLLQVKPRRLLLLIRHVTINMAIIYSCPFVEASQPARRYCDSVLLPKPVGALQ